MWSVGPRVNVGAADAQRVGVFVVRFDEAPGQFVPRLARLVGALDDLVVDVREVLHEPHAKPRVLEVAPHGVDHDEIARVADVEVVVHGRTAVVHCDRGGVLRHEVFLLPCR